MGEAVEIPSVKSRVPLWPPLIIAAVGVLTMMLRLTESSVAVALAAYVSFDALPAEVRGHVEVVLLVPFASILVVFTRTTLGLRMLGPFRPILIGLTFYQTGMILGTTFMVMVLAVIVALRPGLEGRGIPYFGRLSVMLAIVVLAELVVLLVGAAVASDGLMRAAVFPIVVLCLTADGFARVLERDGPREALSRGATTVAIGATISALGRIPSFARFLFEFPEFVFVEIAAIIIVSTRWRRGLFDHGHPTSAQGSGPGSH